MLNIEGFTLRFNDPSRNVGIDDAVLVKVEDEFFAMLYGFHIFYD